MIRAVAARTTNVAGLKVSESPYDKVAPYLALGLRTYIGSEPLLPQALADGAYGSVSGLASAFPAEVRRVLDEPTPEHPQRLASLRDTLGATTFISGLNGCCEPRRPHCPTCGRVASVRTRSPRSSRRSDRLRHHPQPALRQLPARAAQDVAHGLGRVVIERRAVADRDHLRVETGERRPRRLQPRERVHAQ